MSTPEIANQLRVSRNAVRTHMMERTMLLETSYREPGSTPHRETSIDHGDLVVAVSVPPPPGGGRSAYLKVRERASYEFALVSVAASVALHGEVIGEARVALDGVATRPWRAHQTEAMLAGVALDDRAAMREAASAAFAEARPLRDNSFKIDLGTRAIVRALRQASSAVRAFRAWPYWLLAARCR